MKDRTYLPVGTRDNFERKLIQKGDVLLLVDNTKLTFTEMKRVKFWGKVKGNEKFTVVPIWTNTLKNTPWVKEVLGRDESVITKSADIHGFTVDELFSLEGHKETFMYKRMGEKKGRPRIIALDVATGRDVSIGTTGFTYVKIDLKELKEKNV